jgi:hypothetical protein
VVRSCVDHEAARDERAEQRAHVSLEFERVGVEAFRKCERDRARVARSVDEFERCRGNRPRVNERRVRAGNGP